MTRIALLVLSLAATRISAQPLSESRQIPDTAFARTVPLTRYYTSATVPYILVDEAHHNFHTIAGRYRPFAQLLARDGADVRPNTGRFTAAILHGARLLVVANALDAAHVPNTAWRLPAVSAFDSSEIAAVRDWVRGGGALLLIADHMPFAGAATALGAAFGVRFLNGFALPDTPPDPRTGDYPIVFRRGDGSLGTVPNGAKPFTHVDSIASFTGSAFWIDAGADATTVLRLPPGTRVRLPVVAWQFSDSTPEVSGEGLAQGVVLRYGKGKVAVFGEAAMFTAQLKGAQQITMGMNAPIASQNARFVLDLVHWLVGH